MAENQDCTRITLFIFLFSFALGFASKQYAPVFTDLPTHVFQRHLRESRHQPLCILFREPGVGSALEKIVYTLWKNKDSGANYTWWEFGSFSPLQEKLPVRHEAPSTIPAMRCYLGETSVYDYRGRVSRQEINSWLYRLEHVYQEHNQDVTDKLLKSVKEQFDIVLLAFPDGLYHHEIEDMVFGLAAEQDSCKALAVHEHSSSFLEWTSHYEVKEYPSVVVIHTQDGTKSKEDYKVFNGDLEVRKDLINTYLKSKALNVPYLNSELMEKYLYKRNTVEWQFKPVLVLLYAYWAKESTSHLDALKITIEEYRRSFVNLRYGLLDLQESTSKKVVHKFLDAEAYRDVPKTLLFYKGVKGNVTYSTLTSERPYPWVLYEKFESLSNGMLDLTGIEETIEPWASEMKIEHTELYEGPYGIQCSTRFHNLTDNNPQKYKLIFKKKKKPKKSTKLTRIHDMFSSEKIEQQLALHDGIPLITDQTWSEVIEKSHARGHPFFNARQWAGEVTKIALVVFVMADCRSCRNANQTFQELRKQVTFIEGGTMYMINCTAEPTLCSKHRVQGYPAVTVYRGLGWAGTSDCISQKSQTMFKNYVWLEYHGVLLVKPIMEWFSTAAAAAVIDKKFEALPEIFEDKDTRLIATLMPKTSRYLPIPPQRRKDYYFCYECLRLICERLFGVIDCYTQYSKDIPAREFENEDDLEMVITKIELERRDGAKATVMKFGDYLRETLADQSDELIHHFHKPHRYQLGHTQRCEDDHAACADLVTDYTLDHCRLPVTPLSSIMFHTSSSVFKEENLPILLAIIHPENVTEGSEFLQALTSVAYDFYDKVIVMTLNAKQYPWWANNFVPRLYGRERFLDPEDSDPKSMFVFPRLCIVQKHDHRHAAFYPPLSRARQEVEDFSREIIHDFVKDFLANPDSLLEETEQF